MEQNELISGSGGKGKHPHIPVESNDTLKSKQTIKLLFAVAEGEITSIDDILLDKVSISQYTASYSWKSGLSNQTVIPGFIDTESPLPTFTSVQLIKATFFTYNIDSLVNSVRLTISLDSLRKIQENGDITGYNVSVDIYTKATTSSSQILYTTTTKKGKASNTYTWDIIVDRPTNYVPGTNWSIVVNRASADDANVKHSSVTRLTAITQIYHKQLTYPGTALVALTLKDAGEFGGQVPQILIKGKGRKVLVPSNYNPTTRVYTGTWDLSMSSVKQFTDNIAWVLYDVLHDSTCLGIDTADIDKTSFYLLSVYADTLIPDGYGNNIPRYSIGNQFYARDNVPTFIQNLLSICNGMLTENEFGQIKIIFDQPNLSASRLVTNANVVGGLFNYSSNDLENRYSLVNVTYNNYLSYNETDTATWSDNDLITRYGLQTSDIVLPGCIYEAQAIRKARWAVYTNAITTKLLTFNVMFEGLSFRNGSIIKVMDSDNAGVSQHGIVKSTSFSGANTTIVMDRSITLAAQTYTVTFYTTDGVTLYTKTLLQTNSTVSSISFVGTEVPLVGSTFILSGTVVPQLFRVVGNSKNNDDTYTISCLVYDTAKFTYIDQGITLSGGTGDFINIGGFTSPAVTNLAVSPISSTNGINSNIQLNVHWDWNLTNTEKYAATFQATWVRDNNDILEIKDITGNSFDINGAIPGTYDITVWAINPFSGIKSTPATLTYSYRTTAGNSTLLPPVNARVAGTLGLIYSTPALSLLFDYNTLNDSVSDGLLDYVVELWTLTGTTKVGTYVVKPDTAFNGTFNFPFLENLAIFGTSTRSYIIKLYSRDLTGFVSTAYAVTVNNTVPAIQSFTIFSGVSSVFIKVTTTPYEIDTAGYQVHRSLTTGFTPGAGTLVYDGVDSYITLNVPDTQTYYYKIAAYDSFDKTGLIYSSQQANSALTTDAITWTKTGIVFGVGTTNQLTWTAGTIIKSGTTTYTIVAGNATWTTGYLYAYFNPALSTTVIQTTTSLSVAVGIGCYPIATYTGGAATNIKGGTGEAFISGSQIIAGTVGASQIIAGSIVANLLDTTNAVITGEAQIASAVISNAAIKDYIQSSNYNATAHTGWKLDKVNNMITTYGGLQVLDGSGNTILSSGTTPTWNWDNITGTNIPADNATRNVFKGNWAISTVYILGDIVLDSIGYGWSCIVGHTSGASVVTPVYPITSNAYWTLYAVKGVDAVSVILSNDTHTLPASSDGTVGSYVGSGTTVTVYDGTRVVLYDGVGTTDGTWKVVATPTNITVGTLTDSGNYLTVGVASGVAAGIDTASISYAITGRTFNGSAISITAQQSFSKSKAGSSAPIFSINNSAVTFAKGIDNVILPATLTLTTSVSNVTTPTYQWYKSTDGGSTYTTIASATASSYTITSATDYASVTTISYKCIVTGTINGVASQTLNDAITIPLLSDSKSAVSVVLSNENISFPALVTGYTGITFTGGNCDVTAYIGTTQLTPTTIAPIATYIPAANVTLTTGNYAASYVEATGTLTCTKPILTITAIDTALDVITIASNGFNFFSPIRYTYTGAGATIGGLVNNTNHYAIPYNSNSFYVTVSTASTSAGSFVVGKKYAFYVLGTTTQAQWNTITGVASSNHTYGEVFTCANAGVGMGTGTAFELADFSTSSLVAGNVYSIYDMDWNSGLVSTTSFTSGAKLTFMATAGSSAMLGLNTDPATNANYNSIDYAIYVAGTTIYIFESGVNKATVGTYTSTDLFTILYNNDTVSYYKNGIRLYSTDVAKDLTLYVDSSLPYSNAVSATSISNIGFSAYVGPAANTFTYDVLSTNLGTSVMDGTVSGSTFAIPAPTNITAETAYADVLITPIDAAKNPLATITKRINYSLSRAGTNGVNGSNGDSVDIVFVRSATVPATPTASTGTPTAPITWYTSVTAANTAGGIVNPLYSSTGLKTASVGNYTWDAPVRIDGTAVAEVTVFVRSATVPATPTTGGTYTFSATPVVVAPTAPIAWSTSVPSGTNPVYTSRAVVSTSSSNTAAVAISGWSTPVISLQNGTDGAQGPSALMTSSRAASFTATDGTLDASQTDIVFTTQVSGVTSPTYVWTFSGFETSPTNSGSATQTITSAQFGTSKSAIITCTVSGVYVDKMTVVRLEKTTAAAGATVGSHNKVSQAGFANVSGGFSGKGFTSSTNNAYLGNSQSMNLSSNKNYCVSFLAWCSVGTVSFRVDLFPDTLPEHLVNVNTTKTTYSYIFNSASADMQNCALRFFSLITTGATVYITDIILQEGTNPSAWSPSFLDAVNLNNPMTTANITTYISGAAIDTAQIANLAVTSGKIANLAVDTLKIAGNAVVVPVSVTNSTPVAITNPVHYIGQFAVTEGWWTVMTASINLTGGNANSNVLISAFTNLSANSSQVGSSMSGDPDALLNARIINVNTGAVLYYLQTSVRAAGFNNQEGSWSYWYQSSGQFSLLLNTSITIGLQEYVGYNLTSYSTRTLTLLGCKSSA